MISGNSKWYPSDVEDRIYEIMNNPDYWAGIETYTHSMENEIFDMLREEFPYIEWRSITINYPNGLGGAVCLSWVESGHLHQICWDFIYD